MKKKLFVTFLFLVAVSGTLLAQDELARGTSQDTVEEDIRTPATPGHDIPVLNNKESYTEENSYQLNPDQLPATLRSTLQAPEYRGWEEGVITRHLLTGDYRIEIMNGNETSTFMFNTYGERIPDK